MAGGTANTRVQVWRADDGEMLYTLRDFGLNVGKLAFSPDRSLLATGSGDRRLRIYQMEDGKLAHTYEMSGTISRINFLTGRQPAGSRHRKPESKSGGCPIGHFWRIILAPCLPSRRRMTCWLSQKRLTANRSSPFTVCGSSLWWGPFNAEGASLAFSPDGSLLAVTGQDITLWDTAESEQIAALPIRRPFGEITFSPTGRFAGADRLGWRGLPCGAYLKAIYRAACCRTNQPPSYSQKHIMN